MVEYEYAELRTKCGCSRVLRLPPNTKDGVMVPLNITLVAMHLEMGTDPREAMQNKREFKWRGERNYQNMMRIFEETDD